MPRPRSASQYLGAALKHEPHCAASGEATVRARRGMFYNRYDQPATTSGELGTETDINLRQQLVYHVLGTPQARTSMPNAIPAQS